MADDRPSRMTSANLAFLPWVRQGAAAGIDRSRHARRGAAPARVDARRPAARQRHRRPRRCRCACAGRPTWSASTRDRSCAWTRGPAAADFEPNYFAAIEFDRPDFPWLFTPAAADATGAPAAMAVPGRGARNRPASTLRQHGDVAAARARDRRAGAAGRRAARPERVLGLGACAGRRQRRRRRSFARPSVAVRSSRCRACCARACSRPNTDYIACVVPTFELGRKAGLGLDITETELTAPPARAGVVADARARDRHAAGLPPLGSSAPARAATSSRWCRLLKARTVPAGLGSGRSTSASRDSSCRHASPPAPRSTSKARCDRWTRAPPPCPTGTDAPFQTALAQIVNEPGRPKSPTRTPIRCSRRRCTAAGTPRASTVTPGAAPWFDELNLDPRHRGVAAFGTRVVQEHQEALMAAAWEQAAELQHANQRCASCSSSLVVGTSLHTRHFRR